MVSICLRATALKPLSSPKTDRVIISFRSGACMKSSFGWMLNCFLYISKPARYTAGKQSVSTYPKMYCGKLIQLK